MTDEGHEHQERAGMVLAQLLLALAALFSLPLGARDGGGVSSILPPLRSTVVGVDVVSLAAERRRVDDDQHLVRAVGRRMVRRRVHPGNRPRPAPVRRPRIATVRAQPHLERRQSRAPPLVG